MARQVYLTQDMVAIVDDDDYASVAAHKWHATKSNSEGIIKWYAARSLPWALREDGTKVRTKLYLHRFITNCHDPKKIVDHYNGHGLDCTRSNLMVTGYYWNNHNRDSCIDNQSGYRGVFRHQSTRRWEAKLQCQYEVHWLGLFDDPVEGALAYDAKAIELYGPFARTNLREGRLAGKVDHAGRIPAAVQTRGGELAEAPF